MSYHHHHRQGDAGFRGTSSLQMVLYGSHKTCNLRSILDDPPKGWSIQRQLEYFEWATNVYAGLKGVNVSLDAEIEQVLATGIEALSAGDQ